MIKKVFKFLKRFVELLTAIVTENNVLGQFIELCEITPNIKNDDGSEIAPTDFEDLFSGLNDWCKMVGHKLQDKKKTMADLIKWQRKSEFGIQMGKESR